MCNFTFSSYSAAVVADFETYWVGVTSPTLTADVPAVDNGNPNYVVMQHYCILGMAGEGREIDDICLTL